MVYNNLGGLCINLYHQLLSSLFIRNFQGVVQHLCRPGLIVARPETQPCVRQVT